MSNPPAFPSHGLVNSPKELGMTLRDYFAAAIAAALVNRGDCEVTQVKLAYEYADAMLKARDQ